jgi:hypothetical protein
VGITAASVTYVITGKLKTAALVGLAAGAVAFAIAGTAVYMAAFSEAQAAATCTATFNSSAMTVSMTELVKGYAFLGAKGEWAAVAASIAAIAGTPAGQATIRNLHAIYAQTLWAFRMAMPQSLFSVYQTLMSITSTYGGPTPLGG